MPRSGTSLVEQVLGSHHSVYGAGDLEELHQVVLALNHLPGDRGIYPVCLGGTTRRELAGFADLYLQALRRRGGDAARITDKMPRNFLHLGLFRLLFPQGRVTHCRREPLDTCLSCYFHDFAGAHPYSYRLDMLGNYYRAYEVLMEHWAGVLDMPFMEVRYEDMVSDLESQARRMLEFCGLDWQDSCLRFFQTQRAVATASREQVRMPVYTSSVGRWRNYQQHIGQLIETLGNGHS